jgi:hypothetical protein
MRFSALLLASTTALIGTPAASATSHRTAETPRAETPRRTAETPRQTQATGATASVWLQPPPVLPLPSHSGPEGPPRPFGVEPPPGSTPPSTSPRLARAQDHALLYGPFPQGGLTRGVSDGTLLLNEHSEVRGLALTRIRATGASVVRIPVDWRDLVSEHPPATFDARDPADMAYRFGLIDAAVLSTVAAGLTPLLVVSHAPAFAEAPHRWPYAYPGSWAPSPMALEEFAATLARRYDGSFPDPLAPGHVLPRVTLFQAWNEPNLAHYLEPQWVVEDGRWSAFSPLLYRQLLDGFYAGVKSVQPADVVVAAGVAPNGDPAGTGRMAPVAFLRELLCLTPTAARCAEPARFDVLAFHPLSIGNPDTPAESSLDVSIADAAKVTRLLARAERLHHVLPDGAHPVWVTELNWESFPPARGGVPARLQAPWISRALHRLWIAGIGLVDWQFLIDPYPGLRANTQTGGTVEYQRPAGLYGAGIGGDPASARPKPFLAGFTFPFDPLRVDRGHVRVWGLLMRPGQPVLLQRQTRARPARARPWQTIARLHAGRYGVLNTLVSLAGSARVRLQSGTSISAPMLVPSRRSLL